jgi:hypothetical protein
MESSRIQRLEFEGGVWLSGDFMPGTRWIRFEDVDEEHERITPTHIREDIAVADPEMLRRLNGLPIPACHLTDVCEGRVPDSNKGELLNEEIRQKQEIQQQLLGKLTIVPSTVIANQYKLATT